MWSRHVVNETLSYLAELLASSLGRLKWLFWIVFLSPHWFLLTLIVRSQFHPKTVSGFAGSTPLRSRHVGVRVPTLWHITYMWYARDCLFHVLTVRNVGLVFYMMSGSLILSPPGNESLNLWCILKSISGSDKLEKADAYCIFVQKD